MAVPGGGGGRGGGRGGGGGGGGAAGPFTADSRYAFVTRSRPRTKSSAQRARRGRARRSARSRGRRWRRPARREPEHDRHGQPRRRQDHADAGRCGRFGCRAQRQVDGLSRRRRFGRGGSTPPVAAAAAERRGGRGGRGGGGAAAANASHVRQPDRAPQSRHGRRRALADVLAYEFDDSAKVLAYTVASRDSTKDGVYLRNLATGATQTVLTGPGNYRAFTFDRAQQQFAFTSRPRRVRPAGRAADRLSTARSRRGTAQAVVPRRLLPPDMRFADNSTVVVHARRQRAHLQHRAAAEDSVPADSLVGKARVRSLALARIRSSSRRRSCR